MWICILGSSIYHQWPTRYTTSWMVQGTSNLICLKLNSLTYLHCKSLDPTSATYWLNDFGQVIEPLCLSIFLLVSSKSCEKSKMLPYLQTSKLACHSFMDAGRKYATPESKMDSLLLTTAAVTRVLACFVLVLWVHFPQGDEKRVREHLYMQCGYRGGTLSLGKQTSIYPMTVCYIFNKIHNGSWGMLQWLTHQVVMNRKCGLKNKSLKDSSRHTVSCNIIS